MDESVVKHLEQFRENESPQLDTVSLLLLKAAEEIERRGWCQEASTHNGAVCMEGAMLCADGKKPTEFFGGTSYIAFYRVCDAIKPEGFAAPHEWNDQPGRTKEEVVAKLRAVALGG